MDSPANVKKSSSSSSGRYNSNKKEWIRGVNVGGWLLAERFITPYLFAINSCHLNGDLCWYPGQIGMPENATICNTTVTGGTCEPHKPLKVKDGNADYHPRNARSYMDYPIDEYTLGEAFNSSGVSPGVGLKYMERHWDTFVTYQDLVNLKDAGVTHLRVPLSYWIRGDITPDEPWIGAKPGDTGDVGAWKYFVRFAKWCKEIGGLQIWADLHGAPGSENGFDNSGQYLGRSTCKGWTGNPSNVERTVDILTDIVDAVAIDGIADVVSGVGLLNEPFLNCDEDVLKAYYNQGFDIVRKALGDDTAVFVGDMFQAWRFNDGKWWTDPVTHHNTYLDSHPYHVFFEKGRAFTPRQHVAYVCRHNYFEVKSCCFDDAPNNTQPSHGISRIIGEWSAAYDILPTAMAPYIMKTIASTGEAPYLNRTLSKSRKQFMNHFVKAQMVSYEAKDDDVSSGWLFWNFKMEGGAFAEWDFLRGIQEGWMPPLPKDRSVASQDLYGTCLDIYNETNDDYDLIVDEYPDPRTLDWTQYQGWDATDDFVLSDPNVPEVTYHQHKARPWFVSNIMLVSYIAIGVFVLRRRMKRTRELVGYEELK